MFLLRWIFIVRFEYFRIFIFTKNSPSLDDTARMVHARFHRRMARKKVSDTVIEFYELIKVAET